MIVTHPSHTSTTRRCQKHHLADCYYDSDLLSFFLLNFPIPIAMNTAIIINAVRMGVNIFFIMTFPFCR